MTTKRLQKHSNADRRARNRLMLEDRATGMTWTAIGKKYGVSHETARKGAQEAAKIQAELGVVDVDPANVMANVVRAQVRALYRLQELSLDDDQALAVRAATGVGAAGGAVRASLVAVGLWAESGDEERLRRQAKEMAHAFIQVAKETGLPLDKLRDAMEAKPEISSRVQIALTPEDLRQQLHSLQDHPEGSSSGNGRSTAS